jgi:hypothetical protein
MIKNKQKQIEVNADTLFSISVKIIDLYNLAPNIQSILLLSYLTVKEFSRKQEHLDKNAKLELCYQYTPDLITRLQTDGLITEILSNDMKLYYETNDVDIKNILETFYIISDYKSNITTPVSGNKCCFT